MYTTLIEAAELAERYGDPEWTVVDCRFDLAQPEWGVAANATAHIPGALYAHLDRELSGPQSLTNGRPTTGRHPLPATESLAATFSRWGIDENVQVVTYDQGNGAYAARLWWLLRWLGHVRVAVLNGGFAAWQQAGLPVESTPGTRRHRTFVARPANGNVVSTAELERSLALDELAKGEVVLVDARAADRFAGQNETIDPVAGHIPGARNHPFVSNVDARGRFLAPEELRGRWQKTLDGRSSERAVAMCGSGVTACHNLLALEVAGLPGARLYAGSWSEWIRNPARPVAHGQ